jgi:hypothetical protein
VLLFKIKQLLDPVKNVVAAYFQIVDDPFDAGLEFSWIFTHAYI